MQLLGQILQNRKKDHGKYVTKEFQDYGYRLAIALDDLKHKSLYIKLAKNEDKELLEEAKNFVLDSPKVRSKGRLFMWKLKELKRGGSKGLKSWRGNETNTNS